MSTKIKTFAEESKGCKYLLVSDSTVLNKEFEAGTSLMDIKRAFGIVGRVRRVSTVQNYITYKLDVSSYEFTCTFVN